MIEIIIELYFGGVVNRRPGSLFLVFADIIPVVVVSQPDLGDVQNSVGGPLADIDPHVDCPEESFDPAGRFSIEPVSDRRKKIRFGVGEGADRMREPVSVTRRNDVNFFRTGRLWEKRFFQDPL